MNARNLSFVVGLVVAGSTSASELIASVESVKGGALAVGLDLVSDGTVAGFSFAVELPSVDAKAIRSSNCVSQLPKGFTAQCSFSQGKLFVIASADAPGSMLSAGVTPVGTLMVASPMAKASSIRISSFETSNDNGVSTAGTAKVDGVAMGDSAR
ncbi:MAG: hypothetical protein ACK59M_13840 [Pseudomonadota bacterium]|jgi:hypothetical protein